ncbi:ABC transporter ATP-binding protein [Rubeoparvulum massiliense]|uniref:ABC transporter ATP-binding protein n=1 Tax=Rubeoparvulum massiliense TaxID=1631346 RepID=UPI00065E9B41|nr:ABC transporter ATP-binding protein [Rubeoparvulum massiliense]
MIKATGLKKSYRNGNQRYDALKGIDLSISRGEFVAIMGPSGSGKSTLLHLLGGLDLPTGGELLINGTELSNLSEKKRCLFRRNTIGFVFQNYQLIPAMTVAENIALPMQAAGKSKEEIHERVQVLVEAVGLLGKEHAFPSQLSGGQQQRVAVARALVMQPPLVLADEPTGNLDRKRGSEILTLLSQLHTREGLTIVMVTHDLYAASFAERAILLKDGAIEVDVNQREEAEGDVMADFLAKLHA